jgi:hypothetical protein
MLNAPRMRSAVADSTDMRDLHRQEEVRDWLESSALRAHFLVRAKKNYRALRGALSPDKRILSQTCIKEAQIFPGTDLTGARLLWGCAPQSGHRVFASEEDVFGANLECLQQQCFARAEEYKQKRVEKAACTQQELCEPRWLSGDIFRYPTASADLSRNVFLLVARPAELEASPALHLFASWFPVAALCADMFVNPCYELVVAAAAAVERAMQSPRPLILAVGDRAEIVAQRLFGQHEVMLLRDLEIPSKAGIVGQLSRLWRHAQALAFVTGQGTGPQLWDELPARTTVISEAAASILDYQRCAGEMRAGALASVERAWDYGIGCGFLVDDPLESVCIVFNRCDADEHLVLPCSPARLALYGCLCACSRAAGELDGLIERLLQLPLAVRLLQQSCASFQKIGAAQLGSLLENVLNRAAKKRRPLRAAATEKRSMRVFSICEDHSWTLHRIRLIGGGQI